MYKTATEFIRAEIAIWGEDYIFDLIERGYEPVLTTAGWRWLLCNSVLTQARSDAIMA